MATVYSASPASSEPAAKKIPLSEKILQDIKKDLSQTRGSRYSFYSFPKNYNFETQEQDEKIVLLLRPHFIANLGWLLVSLLMIAAPLFLPFIPLISFLPLRFQTITILLWYLLTLTYVIENFLSWYFNIFIVTDERVIDIDFNSLLYKHISQAELERIEDITYVQGGFAQSMLNYGTVYIQTAAEIEDIQFELVPEPAKVVKVLNQLLQQEQQERLEGRVR